MPRSDHGLLLVEDNPHDAELTIRALSRQRVANDIQLARDGAEALDYVFGRPRLPDRLAHRPTVILLDLKLPKVDGLEVLKELKSDPLSKSIPVVVLTSSREESDRLRSYEVGVNSYIVKPVEFQAFGEAVAQLGLYWMLLNQPTPARGPGA